MPCSFALSAPAVRIISIPVVRDRLSARWRPVLSGDVCFEHVRDGWFA